MNPYAVALYAMLVALHLGGFIYCNPDNPAVCKKRLRRYRDVVREDRS